MGWAGHVANMEEMINAYNILDGKPEGKRPGARPRCRWEYNIRMYIREIGWEDVGTGFVWLRIGTSGGSF
jgi:hypothetical protein